MRILRTIGVASTAAAFLLSAGVAFAEEQSVPLNTVGVTGAGSAVTVKGVKGEIEKSVKEKTKEREDLQSISRII